MYLLYKHDPDWQRETRAGACEALGSCTVLRAYGVPVAEQRLWGRTLAFFSDVHWRGDREERFTRIVTELNAREPDWIVYGGDLVRHLADLPAALERLGRLRARHGCFAVRGNRESCHHWRTHDFWRKAYAEIGFRMLINEVLNDTPEDPVFVGLDDARHGTADTSIVDVLRGVGRTVVTLTHTPDAVGDQGGLFLGNLVLAGHTHGGQFRLPLWGALYTSSRYGRQFDRGWFVRRDGTRMYVTSGAGETGHSLLRRRLFCPPEVVIFEFISP